MYRFRTFKIIMSLILLASSSALLTAADRAPAENTPQTNSQPDPMNDLMCRLDRVSETDSKTGKTKDSVVVHDVPLTLKGSAEADKLRELIRDGLEIAKASSELRYNLYFSFSSHPDILSTQTKIESLKKSLVAYKASLIEFARSAKPVARSALRLHFLTYFSVAADLIQSELFLSPYSLLHLNQYDSVYQIVLTIPIYEDVFATFNDEFDHIAYTPVKTAEHKPAYRLTISQKQILTYLTRALARSTATRASDEALPLTSKCLLGTEFIDRYVANNLLMMKVPTTLPNGINGSICGNIEAQDILETLVHDQADFLFLFDEKAALLRATPSFATLLSKDDIDLFTDTQTSADGKTTKTSLANFTDVMLFESSYLKDIRDPGEKKQAQDLLDKRQSRFAHLFKQLHYQIPNFDDLNAFSSLQTIKDGLKATFNLCANDSKMDDVFSDFRQAEVISFFVNPDAGLQVSNRLSGINDINYKNEIYRMIARQKIVSLTEAAQMIFTKYVKPIEPIDISNLTTRFRIEVIEPAVKQEMADDQARGTLDAYVKWILSRQKSFVRHGETLGLARQKFDEAAAQAAVNVHQILSAHTFQDFSQIEYSRAAIAGYYGDRLGKISSLTRPMIKALFDITDLEAAHLAYGTIDDALEKDFVSNNYGVDHLQEPSAWQRFKTGSWRLVTSPSQFFWPSDSISRPEAIREDRSTLNQIAGALGINGKIRERVNLTDAVFDQSPTENQKKFIDTYLHSLADVELGGFRILDMPHYLWARTGSDMTPLYETIATHTSSGDYVSGVFSSAIEIAINNNIDDLKKLLPMKSVSDMKVFIQSATTLGSLLGQNELREELLERDLSQKLNLDSGNIESDNVNVFSELLGKYQALREQWKDEEAYKRLVWDEVLNSTFALVNPLNEVFFGRLALKFLPRFLRVPSLLSSAGLTAARDVHEATSDYWTWAMAVMGVDAAYTGYYGFVGDQSRENDIDQFSFTDATNRSIIAFQDYRMQKDYFESEKIDEIGRFKEDVFWSAFPLMVGPAFNIGYIKPYQLYLKRFEKKIINLREEGKYDEAKAVGAKFEPAARDRFTFIANTLELEFRALDVPYNMFVPSKLAAALDKIKKEGDAGRTARAEQAYRRIMTEIAKGLTPFFETKEILDIYAKTIFGTESELAVFVRDFSALNRKPGGRP